MRALTPLNKIFTIGWGILLLVMVGLEVSGPRYLEIAQLQQAWDVVFYLFLGWELGAVLRKAKGDTFSEHVWVFETGKARLGLVSAMVLWLAWHFSMLDSGVVVGRIILSGGLVAWLLPHFWFKGKHG